MTATVSEHHRAASWSKVLRTIKPRVQASLPAPCIEPGCHHLVQPDDAWDLGHVVSVERALRMGWTRQMIDDPSNLGPACRAKNRSNGGKAGRAKQLAIKRQKDRYFPW